MPEEHISLEERKKQLQQKVKCPLGDGKILIFTPMMDPYNRRYVVLQCPAKRAVITNPQEWKVYEEDIEKICCNPSYATVCEWYKKAKS